MTDIKQQVRQFYNQVGWQEVSEGVYQNAHYEDLRPVSREYIHRCHLRVRRHLASTGKYLLDAGSGPIQYPEYLEYSQGYRYRLCADISESGLQEARRRIGAHGLFVVCDIANLPFKAEAFDGVVSLHTIHHLPIEEHARAYDELYRVLAPGRSAVIVNGWGYAPLAHAADQMVKFVRRWREHRHPEAVDCTASNPTPALPIAKNSDGEGERRSVPLPTPHSPLAPPCSPLPTAQKGTFVKKHDAPWFQRQIAAHIPCEIWVWRSVNVHFLRTFIHERLGGRFLLRLLYWLEERFPHFLGRNGQYPLIVLCKEAFVQRSLCAKKPLKENLHEH